MSFLRRHVFYRFFLDATGRSFVMKPCRSFVLFSGACFGALFLLEMGSFKRKCKAIFSSRGCFGCSANPPTISEADATSKRLRGQERLINKSSITDDFWSTSAGEMENSAVHSQGTLNQLLDPYCNAGSTSNNPPEFVNHGKFKSFISCSVLLESLRLLLWNQTRQQWLGNKKTQNRIQVRGAMISWNATYDSLLESNKPFPQPVPLAEMVDFLLDVWEQEGLDD
ncbi:hypothetical protein SADUNF_Sadunf06G0204100 [Salix dunnii]|uniref:Gag1-like clamp domain-containing protein n=1 Tax=Salix dunnii TaxID=1413687 RepID=A0A835MW90_9ROSI|nr:hypothetical protein SADUNF_Sadunf06G0204100 [Salix dunnii]